MTLAEFQGIYWLEYVHRLWGRIIGLAFIVPFAFFVWKRWVRGALAAKLALILAIGAGQGVLGWYMVMSGLVDAPDVSPYRLTAHLALALVVHAAMLWLALDLLLRRASGEAEGGAAAKPPCVLAAAVALMVFVTAISGGLVAGLDAGFVHNTFPLMDGELLPAALYDMNPPYLSAFEDVTTVQFNHRWLALATLAFAWGLWWRARKAKLARVQRLAVVATAALATVQVALGILTLLLAVPLALAAAHQGNAVLALSAAVAAAHQLRGRPAPGGG
jgi:cytochrome c oxidase assembly protein subunit 15